MLLLNYNQEYLFYLQYICEKWLINELYNGYWYLTFDQLKFYVFLLHKVLLPMSPKDLEYLIFFLYLHREILIQEYTFFLRKIFQKTKIHFALIF